MNEVQMQEKIERLLTPERFLHTIGVKNTAVMLANLYGCDAEKAAIAALLHDCAKDLNERQILHLCSGFGIVLDDICMVEKQLIHGPLGAYIAKDRFGIHDEEILEAIYFHTLAKENMTVLTKVIYLSDYIEPSRDFPGVEKLRQVSFNDLNRAVLYAIDSTIKYVMLQGKLIHPNTVNARNYIILHEVGIYR